MCLYDNYKEPWLIGGDFNEIIHASDKFGGRTINIFRYNKFLDCINYCHLSDLGYKGSRYAWTNSRCISHNILEHIDRFLANYNWINYYPDALVTHLLRTHYDHCLFLLQLNYRSLPHQKLFRFKTIWASHPAIPAIVQHAWQAHPHLLPALAQFTETIQVWNKTTFENIFKRKKKILARFAGSQSSINYPSSIFLQDLERQLLIDT